LSRSRNIYQVELAYVGPTGTNPATGRHYIGAPLNYVGGTYDQPWGNNSQQAGSGANAIAELFRVQSANYSWSRTLKDVNQFGNLAAIDRISLDPPTVTCDISWLVSNLINEKLIGFTVSSGTPITLVSGIINKTTDPKNYFIKTVAEGTDAIGENTNDSTIFVTAIGNGFITNYTAQGSVGNFPTATISVEGLNFEMDVIPSGNIIPAVNPTDGNAITGWFYQLPTGVQSQRNEAINSSNSSLSVLRPGDITFNIGLNAGDGFVSESDMKVQNYTVACPIGRTDLQKLGSKYAFSKEINFPVTATMNITADIGDQQSGSLVEIINNNTKFNPLINLKKPGGSEVVVSYFLKTATLDSQAFNSSIGPNKSVTMTFSVPIAGANDTTKGLFISGMQF